MTPEILGIVGAFVALALSVNAYFIKQLVDSINQVKIQTAILIKESTYTDRRLNDIEVNQKEIFKRLNDVEKRG